MQRDLAAMRRDYRQGTLTEEMAGVDPLTLFDQWIVAARDAGQIEANAMTLATVDAMGHPHARIVLLKEQVARDFVFFTNYQSAKGQQLAASPCAALVFWWDVLERQVRIEGPVRRIDPKDSDAYFASRPLSSRLGAWASEQSKPITDHAVLETRYAEHAAHYGEAVPRPRIGAVMRWRQSRSSFGKADRPGFTTDCSMRGTVILGIGCGSPHNRLHTMCYGAMHHMRECA